jgi:hypothetical protein
MAIVKLRTSSGTEIIGFLAKDGTVKPFECRLGDTGDRTFYYVIDGENWGTDLSVNGDMVLVDDQGATWLAKDIQADFVPPRT